MFDKKIQHDGFVHFVEYTMVKVSQQSNMYRTVDMKIRVISTLLNLKFLVQSTLVYGTTCIVTGKLVSISVKWSVRKQLSTPLTRCSH